MEEAKQYVLTLHTAGEAFEVLIDEEDQARVADAGPWWIRLPCSRHRTPYAVTGRAGRQISGLMHRIILKAPAGAIVDHINGNGLDNRKANLRLVTPEQSARNTPIRSDNKSGFKGVSWHTGTGAWHAQIRADGKQQCLGYFKDPAVAGQAYADAAARLHGIYARNMMSGAQIRADERALVLAEVERLRTVLDSEDSLLRQLSEWLRTP